MRTPELPIALAAVAHPDDIEFLFSGTLLLLKDKGFDIHMWNLADGSCGSFRHSADEIAAIRAQEASDSASLAGATLHPPLFRDMAVFFDQPSLAKVSSVLREIRPSVILTHSPQDYMEDHQNVARLVTTAAFGRSMPNFATEPKRAPFDSPVRIYHAPPHGLQDGQEHPFVPHYLVDVESVLETKQRLLTCHRSQFSWLDDTQSMASPVEEMNRQASELASKGGRFAFAEGWRRHSSLGFCPPDFDPLAEHLGTLLQKLEIK
jgi:LmbE family N-acetylglucosaminyl deacetylase